ncbi:MAG TPA: hypothetical protein VHO48_01070, partial [Anaerolineaceae bacterium]|nr:hypothetical protein [Anaerolineaceae bacterium]
MNILVFNCGSSSLNYKVFQTQPEKGLQVLCSGKAHRVGVKGDEPAFIEHHLDGQTEKTTTPIPDHRTAARLALDFLQTRNVAIDIVGHRFVHGGSSFQASTRLTLPVLEQIRELLPLAPIHNPNSLSVIEVCRERLPGLPQYLTF